MNKLILIAVLALSSTVLAQDAKTADNAKLKHAFKEMIARQGGFITDTRTQKGRLMIVNAQSEVDAATVTGSTQKFEKDTKIRIAHETGSFDLKTAKRIGEATVYVINDATLPVMLIAADDGWGLVNVGKLRTDKADVFKTRVQKEIVRVAGFLLGAGDSIMFPLCLTGQIRNAESLDQIPSEQLPMDVMQRVTKSMESIGIAPYRRATYSTACKEGWAPAPTNDVQKAVWDKVHELPTEPIEILPEKTPVKE